MAGTGTQMPDGFGNAQVPPKRAVTWRRPRRVQQAAGAEQTWNRLGGTLEAGG